jgi:hypothetical protein
MSSLRKAVVQFVDLWDGKQKGNIDTALGRLRQELGNEREESRNRTRRSRERHHADANG